MWSGSHSLTVGRALASVAKSENGQKIVITGGSSGQEDLNTAEILTPTGWTLAGWTLPVRILGHCSLFVDDSTLMLIGGVQDNANSNQTHFFGFEVKDSLKEIVSNQYTFFLWPFYRRTSPVCATKNSRGKGKTSEFILGFALNALQHWPHFEIYEVG